MAASAANKLPVALSYYHNDAEHYLIKLCIEELDYTHRYGAMFLIH
ncbi:hypothetical protein [Gilliamella apicola]|nr:hypothetical protein [Gilliamella apicola]